MATVNVKVEFEFFIEADDPNDADEMVGRISEAIANAQECSEDEFLDIYCTIKPADAANSRTLWQTTRD